MPTFAVAAGSTFTGFNNSASGYRICMGDANVGRELSVFDTTQSGDTDTYLTGGGATVTVTTGVFRGSSRDIMRIQGTGFFQTSADAGTTWVQQYAIPSGGGAAISGAVQGRVSRVTLQRNMGLMNVTASNDALRKTVFAHTKVWYNGSALGYLETSETPLDNTPNTTPSTLTLPLGTGSVAGPVVIDTMAQGLHFNRGGPHELATPLRLTGAVTTTSTPFDIISFTASINLGNSQTLSGEALLSVLRTDINYDIASPLMFQFSGVISDFAFA